MSKKDSMQPRFQAEELGKRSWVFVKRVLTKRKVSQIFHIIMIIILVES